MQRRQVISDTAQEVEFQGKGDAASIYNALHAFHSTNTFKLQPAERSRLRFWLEKARSFNKTPPCIDRTGWDMLVRGSEFLLANHPPEGCPIQTLPNEILSEIFSYPSLIEFRYGCLPLSAGSDIGRVCLRWLSIVYKTPALWNNLSFYLNCVDTPPSESDFECRGELIRRVSRILMLSAGLPLDILVSIDGRGYLGRHMLLLELLTSESVCKRWRSVDFTITISRDSSMMFENLLRRAVPRSVQYPHLQSIIVDLDIAVALGLNTSSAPQLREVSLVVLTDTLEDVTWGNTSFSHLTSLDLHPYVHSFQCLFPAFPSATSIILVLFEETKLGREPITIPPKCQELTLELEECPNADGVEATLQRIQVQQDLLRLALRPHLDESEGCWWNCDHGWPLKSCNPLPLNLAGPRLTHLRITDIQVPWTSLASFLDAVRNTLTHFTYYQPPSGHN